MAITLRVTGRESVLELPSLVRPATRSGGESQDAFLPPGYLAATAAFDVGPAARGSAEGVSEKTHIAAGNEVMALELADGSTFITSAERLREALAVSSPDMIGENGELLLEKLRAEGAAHRGFLGEAVGGLVSKVFTFIAGAQSDDIVKDAAKEAGLDIAQLGVSWRGTKYLMSAIENRLEREPGRLYRWTTHTGKPDELQPLELPRERLKNPEKERMLVFIHGTGSSTLGSFGDLQAGDRDLWSTLQSHFNGRIYAFEHRTLSEGPIDNALQLAKALPDGAHVSFVSHSRGGLVADLLCLGDFDPLIDSYCYPFEGTGDPDSAEATRVKSELDDAHKQQRGQLRELAALLRRKKLVVERYVRTASPANGTKLASGNFDLFLSGLLTLIGSVPYLFGSPYYAAFKRVVIDIAKNRTNPHLVPGIEAMLPDSPMARLLRDAPVREGTRMAIIAGDAEGGNMLRRLGLLLTDFLFFDNTDNDLVVDTEAMLSGIGPALQARVLFDRGADVSHFRYFANLDTRSALRSWLTAADPMQLQAFTALPGPDDYEAALEAAASRDAAALERPVVVVLPGVMGSHLTVDGKDRVWLDIGDIATGGLDKIQWGSTGIEAEELFAMSYGELCQELAKSHRVERFPYDWRQPLDVLAERFGAFLQKLLKETDRPIRLLAHSMGGLVIRACIYARRPIMDAVMAREGARLIMCGTPHQGAHSMVENLIGKGDTLRNLVRLDVAHDMQEILDIVAGFRGPLQLLPRPGFKDIFQGDPSGGELHDFSRATTWDALKVKVKDFWFGNNKCATPEQSVLDAGSWLWQRDNEAFGGKVPALPAEYASKSVYVFGIARNTPCGVREESGRLKMVGTTRGDGTVTWESGRIGNIGSFYYMDAVHGDLLGEPEHFDGLTDLLTAGTTARLPTTPPAVRAIEQPAPVTYDAGPPSVDDAVTVTRAITGASRRNRVPARAKYLLDVGVKAMDVRFLTDPIMVGHYEQDPIAGPEALIDRELLDGDLSERYNLGLYPGPRGSAVVVLRAHNNFGRLRGAVVTGLGRLEGTLSTAELTDAVRTGAMRYLLHVVDVCGKKDHEVSLASLLIGYNSTANMTIEGCVEALVRGVMEANASFQATTRLNIRISRLDIVELYRDTAITAVYALRQVASRISVDAAKHGTALSVRNELYQGDGVRPRLFDSRSADYWPRLIVTDAGRCDDEATFESHSHARGNLGASAHASAMPTYPLGVGGSTGFRPDGVLPVNTSIANRIRFLYVGQRARAESVVQQRQPGLVETIVRQQILDPSWNRDLGRMLFQLMVPHAFKDSARQLARVVLVVDSYTANLPWELMLADDTNSARTDVEPLALRTAMVRQLATMTFRPQVRQVMERRALVIGDPSVAAFEAWFVAPDRGTLSSPGQLPGAAREAEEIAKVLRGVGYDVEAAIGKSQPAHAVLTALYRRPYRIVHVSAHGIFNMLHRDGMHRSGVVLSDGLLLTATEVAAMETVPELVFLNCCHLGQIETARDGNRLAASIARELIDIGVRCVIVAGWAVNDDTAALFGTTFYSELLLQRLTFGEAVQAARRAVFKRSPSDITWGAFQAYGDAGWRAEPGGDGGSAMRTDCYASPDELLDYLAGVRTNLARKADRYGDAEIHAVQTAVEEQIKKRCPPGWLHVPHVRSALGATWRDLGMLERAREQFLAAIQAEDELGHVPIRDIEQLANVEARLGERQALDAINRRTPDEAPERLIDLALRRLDMLDMLVSAAVDAEPKALLDQRGSVDPRSDRPIRAPNSERSALRGSAYKRKASLFAQRALQKGIDQTSAHAHARSMQAALESAAAAYREGEGASQSGQFLPYPTLNRLALEALLGSMSDAQRNGALALAQQSRIAAQQGFQRTGRIWEGVMQGEALVVQYLIDGRLRLDNDDGEAAFDALVREYEDALANVLTRPGQLDSVLSQFELLSRFYDVYALWKDDAAYRRVADRLLGLVQHIRPGRPQRTDRPGDISPQGGTPKVPRKGVSRKVVVKKATSKTRARR